MACKSLCEKISKEIFFKILSNIPGKPKYNYSKHNAAQEVDVPWICSQVLRKSTRDDKEFVRKFMET